MRRFIVNLLSLSVIAALLLTACQPRQTPAPTPTLPPTPLPSDTPRPTPRDTAVPSPSPTVAPGKFISAACMFDPPPSLNEGINLECGYLVAPLDRSDPYSDPVQLAVAILRYSGGDPQPDPIFYLEGGPGGSALEFLNLVYDRRFAPILEAGRDIILFDQRGVGLSRPALDCPEQDALFYELLDNEKDGQTLSESEMNQLNLQAMQNCAANLSAKTDLSYFSTDLSAADVRDLAQALGYAQINLWAVSYGTRLALEVMRDYPQIVRSAVLDSSLPPQVNLYDEQPANLGRALDLLFAACAADNGALDNAADATVAPPCNLAYPDLENVFYTVVDLLNFDNLRFTATDPISGRSYPTAISGDNFVDLTFQFLYDADIIPLLPQLIYDVRQGKTDLLALLVGSLIASQPAVSDGMHQAVQCAEEIPFNSPQRMKEAAAKFPQLASYFDQASLNLPFDTCKAMQIAASSDPTVSQAVTSDIPTLVLAGEFDPITPPAWGELVAEGLENSHFFVFPGQGHAPSLSNPCARSMAVKFIQNPQQAPDATCLEEMGPPQFITPPPSEVMLIPFENQDFQIRGVRPETWEEVSPGVFSRQHSSLDVALVLAQSAPLSAANLLSQISRQLGLSQPPEPVDTLETNGLTWTLYAFSTRGVQVDMAITEDSGTAMLVLLQSTAGERDNLYQKVFLPMVEELVPI